MTKTLYYFYCITANPLNINKFSMREKECMSAHSLISDKQLNALTLSLPSE